MTLSTIRAARYAAMATLAHQDFAARWPEHHTNAPVVDTGELTELLLQLRIRVEAAIFASRNSQMTKAHGLTATWTWPSTAAADYTSPRDWIDMVATDIECGVNALSSADPVDLYAVEHTAATILELIDRMQHQPAEVAAV